MRVDSVTTQCVAIVWLPAAQAIITNLKQVDDEAAQLGALTELCEVLSISSEDTLVALPIETVVPLLVRLLVVEWFFAELAIQSDDGRVLGGEGWEAGWVRCARAALG